jgi:hypothetical protein
MKSSQTYARVKRSFSLFVAQPLASPGPYARLNIEDYGRLTACGVAQADDGSIRNHRGSLGPCFDSFDNHSSPYSDGG